MLFDLRSRGRRRTVRTVYILLAALIVVGLLGVGFGGAGLFSLASNGNGGGGGSGAINKQTKQALAQAQAHPHSAAAWAGLVSARFSAANAAGFDSSTHSYTTTGQQQLGALTQDYAHYLRLVSTPSSTTAQYAAETDAQLGHYADAATAWQAVVGRNTSDLSGLQCIAMSALAAKNTRIAALAERELYANKLPKATKTSLKASIASVKAQPSALATYCGSAGGG